MRSYNFKRRNVYLLIAVTFIVVSIIGVILSFGILEQRNKNTASGVLSEPVDYLNYDFHLPQGDQNFEARFLSKDEGKSQFTEGVTCILVKFKDEAAGKLQGSYTNVQNSGVGQNLLRLFERYTPKATPLYVNLLTHIKQQSSSLIKHSKNIRNKFPERSKRIVNKNVELPKLMNWFKLCPKDTRLDNLKEMIMMFKNNPEVKIAELNYKAKVVSVNDPFYNSQGSWGQNYDDLWGIKIIESEGAWNETQGENSIVAVIDTGVDYTHEDLGANIWQNESELQGQPGIDDDGNGFIDDLKGWDFAYNDNDPIDDHGHGSHVAGTIAGVGNNNVGVIGVAPRAHIMPLKGLNASGSGSIDGLVEAIIYATNSGADILSNSWGGNFYSQAIVDAFDYAYGMGVVSIAAAGNNNGDAFNFSPANIETVIAVAASTQNDEKTYFSNYGLEIDVSAPGGGYPEDAQIGAFNILSSLPEGTTLANSYPQLRVAPGYYRLAGTSMACPHVSGEAALILSKNLTEDEELRFTVDDVRNIIRFGVDPVTSEELLGTGRINARKAVEVIYPLPVAKLNLPDVLYGTVDFEGSAHGRDIDDPNAPLFSSYTISYTMYPANKASIWAVIYSSNEEVEDGNLIDGFHTESLPEDYMYMKLTVTDSFGRSSFDTQKVYVNNIEITNPQHSDIYKPGKIIDIMGTVTGGIRSYEIHHGVGYEPSQWVTTGISLENNGTEEVINGKFGAWNTSFITENEFYTLKLTAHYNDGSIKEEYSYLIYFDTKLKEGWPARIEQKMNWYNDAQEFTVADIDLDGNKEVIAYRAGNLNTNNPPIVIPTLFVFNHDGSYKFDPIEFTEENGFPPPYPDGDGDFSTPTVGNLDEDPELEIVVGLSHYIYVFNHDGTIHEGWPHYSRFPEPEFNGRATVIADIDNDGQNELIVGSYIGLSIFNQQGEIQASISNPVCPMSSNHFVYPAVGNIDDNFDDLEIIHTVGCNQIAAYKFTGSSLELVNNNWPVSTYNEWDYIDGAPVLADVNDDGKNEIFIVASNNPLQPEAPNGGFYAISSEGEILWHVLNNEGLGELTNTASFVKIDSQLRISLPYGRINNKAQVYLFDKDGSSFIEWPVQTGDDQWLNFSFSTSIGDITGDNEPELVMAGVGYNCKYYWTGDLGKMGGLSAWKLDGTRLQLNGDFFPIFMETAWCNFAVGTNLRAPVVITDIDSDGIVDVVASSYSDVAWSKEYGKGYLKNRHSFYVWSLDTPYRSETMHWPMFQHDPQHTGRYRTPNQSPVAIVEVSNLGPIVGENVNLDGRRSYDPDGEIIKYLWKQVSGVEVIINNPTSPEASFVMPYSIDPIVIELLVIDNEYESKRRSREFIMDTTPPVADAGQDQVGFAGNIVELDGSHSDAAPNKIIVSYQWEVYEADISIDLVDAHTATPYFVVPNFESPDYETSVTLKLTVTDSNFIEDSDTVQVTLFDYPPFKPVGLSATVVVPEYSVQLRWKSNDIEKDVRYQVWRRTIPGILMRIADVSEQHYYDKDVSRGVRYEYWVLAYDEHYQSEFSDSVKIGIPHRTRK